MNQTLADYSIFTSTRMSGSGHSATPRLNSILQQIYR